VKDAVTKIPQALLKVFSSVVEALPPTPTKFHYIFNLRDLARVCEGVCLATSDKVATEHAVARLFRNEATRVFCDRLATEADVLLVSKAITEVGATNEGKGRLRGGGQRPRGTERETVD
jgi:dynein heavy chain